MIWLGVDSPDAKVWSLRQDMWSFEECSGYGVKLKLGEVRGMERGDGWKREETGRSGLFVDRTAKLIRESR